METKQKPGESKNCCWWWQKPGWEEGNQIVLEWWSLDFYSVHAKAKNRPRRGKLLTFHLNQIRPHLDVGIGPKSGIGPFQFQSLCLVSSRKWKWKYFSNSVWKWKWWNLAYLNPTLDLRNLEFLARKWDIAQWRPSTSIGRPAITCNQTTTTTCNHQRPFTLDYHQKNGPTRVVSHLPVERSGNQQKNEGRWTYLEEQSGNNSEKRSIDIPRKCWSSWEWSIYRSIGVHRFSKRTIDRRTSKVLKLEKLWNHQLKDSWNVWSSRQ